MVAGVALIDLVSSIASGEQGDKAKDIHDRAYDIVSN
jgi:hypothetical protein